MALLLRLNIFWSTKQEGESSNGLEKGRREEETRRKKEEEEEKRRRKKEEEFKEDSKVWNLTFSMDYLDFLVWIHVLGCGL